MDFNINDFDVDFDTRFFVFITAKQQLAYCKMTLDKIVRKPVEKRVVKDICGGKYEFDEKYLPLVDFIEETILKVEEKEVLEEEKKYKDALPDVEIDYTRVGKMTLKERKEYFDNLAEQIYKLGYDDNHQPLFNSNRYKTVNCDGDDFCVHKKYVELFETCFKEVRKAQMAIKVMDAQAGLDLCFDIAYYRTLKKESKIYYCKRIVELIISRGDANAAVKKECTFNGEKVLLDDKYSLPLSLALKGLKGFNLAKVYDGNNVEVANIDVLSLIKPKVSDDDVKENDVVTGEKKKDKSKKPLVNITRKKDRKTKRKKKREERKSLKDKLYSVLSVMLSFILILTGLNQLGVFGTKKKAKVSLACERTIGNPERIRFDDRNLDDEMAIKEELADILAKNELLKKLNIRDINFERKMDEEEKIFTQERSIEDETPSKDAESVSSEEEMSSQDTATESSEFTEDESTMELGESLGTEAEASETGESETKESETSSEAGKDEKKESAMEESGLQEGESEEDGQNLEDEKESALALEEGGTLVLGEKEIKQKTEPASEQTDEMLSNPEMSGEDLLASAATNGVGNLLNDGVIYYDQQEVVEEPTEIDLVMRNYDTEITRMSNKDYKMIDYSTIDWEDNNQIKSGYHLTYNNTTYQDINMRAFRILYYVVYEESNRTYEDALGVISVILNRKQDSGYCSASSLEELVMKKSQFAVWDEVKAMNFVNDINAPINENVWNAMYDAIFLGVRNNDYIEFKASYVTGNGKYQIVPGGNNYHNLVDFVGRASKEDVKVLTLDM